MGPETEIARPSAKKFKKNWWRPLAVVVIATWAQVYNEDQASINSDHSPRGTRHNQTLNPEELIKNLDRTLVLPSNSFPLDELRQEIKTFRIRELEQRSSSQIKPELSKATPEENVRVHALSVDSSPVSNSARLWLTTAGWSPELIAEAGEVTKCESSNQPDVINPKGPYYGLFQLEENWFDYAGEDFNKWSDPVVNARVGLKVYQYDLERGQAPWTQWDPKCRPSS